MGEQDSTHQGAVAREEGRETGCGEQQGAEQVGEVGGAHHQQGEQDHTTAPHICLAAIILLTLWEEGNARCWQYAGWGVSSRGVGLREGS